MKIVFVYTGEEYLGIEYLSAVLKEKGHLTQLIYDPLLFNDYYIYNKFLSRLFSFRKRIIREILDSKAELIAFSVNTGEYNWACQIASIIKNKIKIPIVFGGHHATCLPEEVIKEDFIDFVIQGEGEYALFELVEYLQGERSKENVRNLYYKSNGRIYKNELMALIEDLNSLPFPDKELFYSKMNYLSRTYRIMTSRGCPYRCSYCHNYYLKELYKGKGQYVRRRSVNNVIQELKKAKEKYKMNDIMFQDEIFSYHSEWLEEFNKLYKKEIGLPYACYVRPNTMDEKIAFLLRDSGCMSATMGIESIDESVCRRLLNRPIKQSQVIKALQLLKSNQIFCRASFMIGLPGQKDNNLTELARFCNKYKFGSPLVFWLQHFPKTAIAESAKKNTAEQETQGLNKFNSFPGYTKNTISCGILLSKLRFLILLSPLLSRKTLEFVIQKKLYRFFPAYHQILYFGVIKMFLKFLRFFSCEEKKKIVPRIASMPITERYKFFCFEKITVDT